jgi:hypothetical protein
VGIRDAYKILFGNSQVKWPLKDNSKMDFRETGCEDLVDGSAWFKVGQHR